MIDVIDLILGKVLLFKAWSSV